MIRRFIASVTDMDNLTEIARRKSEVVSALGNSMDRLSVDERISVYGFMEAIFPEAFSTILQTRLERETDPKAKDALRMASDVHNAKWGPDQKWYIDMMVSLVARNIVPCMRTGEQLLVARPPGLNSTENSFCIMHRGDDTYLVTHSMRTYRIPREVDIVELCDQCLNASATPLADLPQVLVSRFKLQRVAYESVHGNWQLME